jgi:hypothetical protein
MVVLDSAWIECALCGRLAQMPLQHFDPTLLDVDDPVEAA